MLCGTGERQRRLKVLYPGLPASRWPASPLAWPPTAAVCRPPHSLPAGGCCNAPPPPPSP